MPCGALVRVRIRDGEGRAIQKLGIFRVSAAVLAFSLVLGACSSSASKKEEGTPSAVETSAEPSRKTGDRSVAAQPRTAETGGAKIRTSGDTTVLTAPSGV